MNLNLAPPTVREPCFAHVLDWPPTADGPGNAPNRDSKLDGAAPVPTCTIILASGNQDGGTRATLALSMACTALSMDTDTHVFLVGEGSFWAYQGADRAVRVNGFPALGELLDDYLALGGGMGVCAACDEARCGLPEDERNLPRWPGIQVQGMASVLERMLNGRVVTF